MYTVDLYLRVRLACHVDGLSQREAASRFGIARETVRKMLRHSEPPGYRRRQPPKRLKLAPFTDIIDRILAEDRPVHRKQHHTAKRIFERLRDEHGFTGKETIVKDYVRERRLRRREMFVPLSHPPGHAQADFGEADAIIAGVKYRAHFFVMTLPHSDACFVAAYPAATTEAWLDGHNRAFVFFGGVPQSILYDNDKCLVSRILSDGTRQRTRAFSGLQSHYLFEDRYGRPGKGNDKGNVEGVVGYARRNFMTPLPRFASWDAFNGHLEEQCRNRQGNVLRGHRESIGERFVRDREALKRPLPAPFDACDKQGARVNSLSLVRYRTNDYSVPVAYGHQEVWIRGYVHEVVIGCGAGIIARHPRSYDREDMVFDPIHYLPLLEHKIGALDQAAPLAGWELPDAFPTLRRLLEARMGQGRQAGIRPGPSASGDLRSRGASRRGEGRPAPGCDRLRRRQTPCAVPYRATPAQTRPGYLSLPASGQRGDHGRRQLYELVGWRRVMTDTPQVLLAHHLKTLKLPTFLREYDKLARQCATEGADHVRYLVRLTELELIDRERRMVERRIRQARFPAVKSLDSFDFKAIASLNKMLVLELARCEYVERRENIIALGNSGTGKTHIALGLGLAACQKGLSGARAGGKRGRGAPGKTPFVAAVSTSPEGRPRKVKLVPLKGFRKREIARGAKRWLAPGSEVLTDGLRCWNALDGVVGSHRAIRTGSGRQAARMAPFKWVNTTLGNIKSAITGTYRKLGPDHAQRYLASFAWRYNRRYQLNTMIPRFVHSAARTQPIPYRALIAG